MSNPIGSIPPLKPLEPLELKNLTGNFKTGEKAQGDFATFLDNALTKLEKTQQEAGEATVALVTGQAEDFHTPIIALEKASLTLGLAVTIRNKVLDAYHDIMRMQI
ncbi:MAG TPA: flagellar hook-basal body complex protein FliE [Peptococcaceae bacterium]|nr:flagellar hook-basal body complex protein FliE [Peptococcaceae bacterium]